jgi:tungstate transport system ATP-binding protein
MDEARARAGDSLLPLRLEDVCFAAGGRLIIDHVTLEIAAGARTIVLGPNGAGKSVLMRLCHGLLAPTSGRIVWNRAERPGEPRRQAMVFQRQVMLRRSACANITYALKLAGVPRRSREAQAREALERVGLGHLAQRPARVLSGGEQQRLALARAWALQPEVLFLDEPTASLDPSASAEVERVIQAIHDGGTKIVMSTHNLGQARRLGDEVVFLDQGRVKERAPVDRFFTQPASAEAEAFLKGELPWLQQPDAVSSSFSRQRLRR